MFKQLKIVKKLTAWYQAAVVWAYTRPEPDTEWIAHFEKYERGLNKLTDYTPNAWVEKIDATIASVKAPAWMYTLKEKQNAMLKKHNGL